MMFNFRYHTVIIFTVITCYHDVSSKGENALAQWTQSLAETLHITKNKYYFDIPYEQSMVKMLDAFVHFDDHSRFLGPEDYNDLITLTNGEFYGIGVVLAPKKAEDDYLLILDTIPEGPAYKNKLEKYDKIIAINNQTLEGMPAEQCIKLLKGLERYSQVTLTIMHNEKVHNVTLKRDIVKEEHVKGYHLKDHNIGYCSISLFTHKTAQKLTEFLEKLKNKKVRGLILDLRDNCGGVLQSAVDCASLFLKPNSLVASTKNKANTVIDKFFTKSQPLSITIPTIILVNNFTASAPEILAGALSFYSKTNQLPVNKKSSYHYIFLLGTNTYGKGSVQEVIPVSNNCALKLTTCLYYLPNNQSIQEIGIAPDFIIETKTCLSPEAKLINQLYGKERSTKKDSSLKPDTIESKNNQPTNNSKEKIDKQKLFKSDHQIQSAINLLCLLDNSIGFNNSKLKTHESTVRFLSQNFITDTALKIEQL